MRVSAWGKREAPRARNSRCCLTYSRDVYKGGGHFGNETSFGVANEKKVMPNEKMGVQNETFVPQNERFST